MKTQQTPQSRPSHGGFSMERWRKLYVVSAVETPHHDDSMGDSEPSSNLARIFVVLLLVHVFLIGAIVLYNVFSDHGRGSSIEATPLKTKINSAPSPALAISAPKPPPPARSASPALPAHHVVQSGDSLNSIAQSFGVDQQAIIRENHIDADHPFDIGLDLMIPAKNAPAPAQPKVTTPPAQPKVAALKPVAAPKPPELKKVTPPVPPPAPPEVKNDPPKPAPPPVAKAVPVTNSPPPVLHAEPVSAPILIEETPPLPIPPKPGERIRNTGSGNAVIQESPPEPKTAATEQKSKDTENKSKAASDSSTKAKTTDKVTSSGKTHVVTSSDTLYSLARKYKVKVDDLMKINGITDPKKLRDGMKLKIPATKS